jgi:hypothetical protein
VNVQNMERIKTIRGSKIHPDELVNLLSKWQSSATRLVFTVLMAEMTTMLTVTIHKVEYPTITVALLNQRGGLGPETIDLHFKGCVLHRFEGDEGGVGTVVRASWLSWTNRQMALNETHNS